VSARITRQAAAASIGVAIALMGMKGWSWFESGSVAILASLADSTLDLVASCFTYFAVRYAAAPADRDHRFGHGKAESFAALFQAALVLFSGIWIAVEAANKLVDGEPVRQPAQAFAVMVGSMIATGALIWWQSRAIARTGSIATKGDRAHYAADLASNVVVMIGIAASALLGVGWADAAAGLVVAGWLGYGAWGLARDAADHLMDRELPDLERDRIRALALADSAIVGVHDLRTRASGAFVHIQFHADLDPDLSLRQAHEIVVAAERRIRAEFPASDIIIHPDPLDAAEPHGHEHFQEGRIASG
jgi:cation diffusion facilitator family transporter